MVTNTGAWSWSSGASLKADLYQQASAFAEPKACKRCRRTQSQVDGGFSNFAHAELQFRCLAPGDPELSRPSSAHGTKYPGREGIATVGSKPCDLATDHQTALAQLRRAREALDEPLAAFRRGQLSPSPAITRTAGTTGGRVVAAPSAAGLQPRS